MSITNVEREEEFLKLQAEMGIKKITRPTGRGNTV